MSDSSTLSVRPTRAAGSRYAIGIDVGTTNVKAALVRCGTPARVVGRAAAPHPTFRPRADSVEQSPEAWWAATVRALAGLGDARRLASAVSVSGQGSTVTLCGSTGERPSPAIGWQDGRAAADAAELDRRLRADLARAHGNVTGDAPEPKLRWLRRHAAGLVAASDRALTAAGWIQARLGGSAAISEADAGTWMSWNRHARAWDPDLAVSLHVADLLPPVAPAFADAGRVSAPAAAATGLAPGTSIVSGTSDVAAAALAAGVGKAGEVAYSKGTGGFACCYVAPLADPGPLLALPALRPDVIQICGAANAVGAAWDWIRRVTAVPEYPAAEALAMEAEGGAPLFLPWLAGAAHPEANQRARAVFAELGLEMDARHLLRAVLEGTAAALGEQVAAARTVSQHDFSVVVSTGGATRSSLWNRLDAAAARVPVVVARDSDAAVGSALLAAEGRGLLASALETGEALRANAPRFDPEAKLVAQAEEIAARLRELRPAAAALSTTRRDRGDPASGVMRPL